MNALLSWAHRLVLVLVLVTAADAAPWADNSNQLDPADLPPEWRTLIDVLREPETLRATFEERRLLGFRSEPIVLQGTLRLIRNDALSLHYSEPEDRTVIVDATGVLLRDGRGRSRAAPAEAAASVQPLLRALHFDLAALTAAFTVHGWRDGEEWKLAIKPRETDRDSSVGAIEIGGTGKAVETIYLAPSSRRRISIRLLTIDRDVSFTPEELRRFFR